MYVPRALTDDEIAELFRDPYMMFRIKDAEPLTKQEPIVRPPDSNEDSQ